MKIIWHKPIKENIKEEIDKKIEEIKEKDGVITCIELSLMEYDKFREEIRFRVDEDYLGYPLKVIVEPNFVNFNIRR